MLWFWLAIAGSALWGISYALADKALKHVDYMFYLFSAFAFATLFLGSLLFLQKFDFSEQFKKLSTLEALIPTGLSIFLFTLGNILVFSAISRHNANEVNLVEITYPLFTCITAWLVLKTYTPHFGFFIALALILSGIAVLYLTVPR